MIHPLVVEFMPHSAVFGSCEKRQRCKSDQMESNDVPYFISVRAVTNEVFRSLDWGRRDYQYTTALETVLPWRKLCRKQDPSSKRHCKQLQIVQIGQDATKRIVHVPFNVHLAAPITPVIHRIYSVVRTNRLRKVPELWGSLEMHSTAEYSKCAQHVVCNRLLQCIQHMDRQYLGRNLQNYLHCDYLDTTTG